MFYRDRCRTRKIIKIGYSQVKIREIRRTMPGKFTLKFNVFESFVCFK